MATDPTPGATGGAYEAHGPVNQGATGGRPIGESPLSVDSAGGDAFDERPEAFVGAAFAGGFVLALLLRRLVK